MEYLCTSCGTKFEESSQNPRCPSCLRKNGILPFDEAHGKGRSGKKPYIIEAVVTMVLGVGVGLFLMFGPGSKDGVRAKNEDRFALPTVAQVGSWLKPSGVTLSAASKSWFSGSEVIGSLSKKLKDGKSIAAYVRQHFTKESRFSFTPVLPANAVLQAMARGDALGSLELSLLAKKIMDGAGIDNTLILIESTGGSEPPSPVWEGRFGISFKVNTDEYEQIDFVSTKNVNRFTPVTAKGIVALLLVREALALAGGDPVALRFLYSGDQKKRPPGTAQKMMALFRAAKELAPKSPQVYASGAWIHHVLGLPKPAAKFAEILLSLSETKESKAFVALFRVAGQRLKEADGLLAEVSARWLPLKIFVVMAVHGPQKALPLLDKTEKGGETIDFVRTLLMSGIADRAADAMALCEAMAKKWPEATWHQPILFRLALSTGKFDRARAIAGELAKKSKDPSAQKKALLEQIDVLEKAQRSGASVTAPSSSSVGTSSKKP